MRPFDPAGPRAIASAPASPRERLRSHVESESRPLLVECLRDVLVRRRYRQPANLQGIRNDQIAPPWDSKYTINANLPLNYWAADTTNLSEMVPAVFDMIKDLTVTSAETAQRAAAAS